MERIEFSQESLEQFCRSHHVRQLALFGSVLREDFGPASDVDVLVRFEEGHEPGFIRLARMAEDLSAIFGGRKVDLRTPEDLSRYFREDVLKHAEIKYASS
ncbi:MAG: nucleotidyltransferase [Geothermobacteraceae bacterium]